MNKIQLLDNNMINKIAAGEVVERPASVVKELVENSIDAGTSAVTVEIKGGGLLYIRITDNGAGIAKDQVDTAFMRHATSKISTMEDLEGVMTLGFRGEALSSVASVAQVEMTTKTAADITGLHIELEGGRVTERQEVGCVDGTTIIVRNLFYNVPARRKFMKKPGTEAGYISDYMNRAAMAHPEISFKYINDNTEVLQTSGNNDLKSAIFHIYGRETSQKLLPLDYSDSDISLRGFAGKPELARGNRSYGNVFINGRYIRNDIIQSAVEDAYKSRLMTGKFPVYALYMGIRPELVDVNVHPAKLEVRFAHEETIYNAVYNAFYEALSAGNLIPEAKLSAKPAREPVTTVETKAEQLELSKVYTHSEKIAPKKEYASVESIAKEKKNTLVKPLEPEQGYMYNEQRERTGDYTSDEHFELREEYTPAAPKSFIDEIYPAALLPQPSSPVQEEDRAAEPESEAQPKAEQSAPETQTPLFKDYIITGQIFNTYWIIEQGASIYLIDQHAAHERAIYEELLERFKKGDTASQILLQPLIIKLSMKEMETVRNNAELFEKCGFDVEEFGPGTVAVRAVPFMLRSPVDDGFFMELVDRLGTEYGGGANAAFDMKLAAVASASCKAAVKGGDRLDTAEARALISRLLKLDNPFTCPHGRPTIIEITRYELEKKFKRVV